MTQDPLDAAWEKAGTATVDPLDAAWGKVQTYDTALTPDEEPKFQAWKAKYAPKDSGADYDLRGAFKAGVQPDPKSGHWPDTFKKPNHPTFSDESQYAKDAPDKAGHWDGETYIPPGKGDPLDAAWEQAKPTKPPHFPGQYDPKTLYFDQQGGGSASGAALNQYGDTAYQKPQPYGSSAEDFQHLPPAEDIAKGVAEVPIAALNAIPNTAQGLIDTAGVAIPGLRDIKVPTIPDIPGTEGGIAQGLGSAVGQLGVLAGTGAVGGVPAAASLAGLESFGAHYHSLKANGASEAGAVLGALGQSGVDAAAIAVPLGRMMKAEGGLGNAITTGYVFGGASGAQQVLEDAITKTATPKDMGTFWDWASRAGGAAEQGGLLGIFVGAIHGALAKAPAKVQEAIAERTAQTTDQAPNAQETPAGVTDLASKAPPVPGSDLTAGADEIRPASAPSGEPQTASAPTSAPETVGTTEVPAEHSAAAKSPDVPGGKADVPGESPVAPAGETTGVKHRIVDAERAAAGEAPLDSGPTRTRASLNEQAAEAMKSDQRTGEKLVKSLTEKPRLVTDAEQFVLMHERLRLVEERKAAQRDLEAAAESGGDTEAPYRRIEEIRDQMNTTDKATRAAGSEPARSLGARASEITDKYELADIEQLFRNENKGKPLSKRQETQALELSKRMDKAELDLANLNARLDTADLRREVRARKPKGVAAVEAYLAPKAEAALKRLTSAHTARTIGPDLLADAGIVGAHLIAKGTAKFEAWSKEMVSAIGEHIKPHLETIWTHAQEIHNGEAARERKKAGLRRSIEQGKEKLATGDIQPKKRATVAPDEEILRLEAEKGRVQADIERARRRAKRENQSRAMRARNFVLGWNRAFLLSGPTVLKKLTAAGAARLVTTPAEEVVGAGLSKVFPRLAARAPREGMFSPRAEAMALRDAFTKGMRDSWKTLTTGQSDIEAVHGKEEIYDRTVADFFGSLHQAIKAPVKRAEFTRSFDKRAEHAIRAGEDVSDPVVQNRIALDAYKDANRAIFSQDNKIADAWNAAMGRLESNVKETGKPSGVGVATATAGRFFQPIVKIPTNLVFEVMDYATGSITGGTKLARAYANGIENLGPHEADVTLRLLKKGLLGPSLLALAYFGANQIGGYYRPGKRDPGDPEFKSARVFGLDIDKDLLHSPLLELLQVGATVRHVADKKGMPSGMYAAAIGLLEEVPLAGAAEDAAKMLDPREGEGAFARQVGSHIVPQGIRWLARKLDQDAKRKPTGIIENVQEGLPFLRSRLPLKKR